MLSALDGGGRRASWLRLSVSAARSTGIFIAGHISGATSDDIIEERDGHSKGSRDKDALCFRYCYWCTNGPQNGKVGGLLTYGQGNYKTNQKGYAASTTWIITPGSDYPNGECGRSLCKWAKLWTGIKVPLGFFFLIGLLAWREGLHHKLRHLYGQGIQTYSWIMVDLR